MRAPFRLTLLGTVSLEAPDGAPMSPRAREPRALALLAVLAAARGRPVRRDRLAALLAADGDVGRARIGDVLTVLRRLLGPDALIVADGAVCLDPSRVASDVDRFEDALERGAPADALGSYGGPFLDGFDLPDADAFARWSSGERDRLARRRLRTLERLAAAAERAGDRAARARWLAELVAADPRDAGIAFQAVSALTDVGDGIGARRVGRLHARALHDEREDEPAPALRARLGALHRLLAGCPPSAPYGREPRRPAGSRIAVLPLADLSPEPGDAFLADALAQELARRLARAPGLRVTTVPSSALPRDALDDPRRSAAHLGVDWVVDGSVRRAGDRVRLRLQLVDATDGFTHWSERWDGATSALLERTTSVAVALVRATGVPGAEPRPSGGVRAADCLAYLRELSGRAGADATLGLRG